MRRLIALGAAIAALAPAGAVQAAAPTFEISRPGAAAPTFAFAAGIGTNVTVRGRAAKRAQVTLSVPCARAACTATATANDKGRWAAVLELVLPAGARAVQVTAASGTLQRTAQVRLAAPAPVAAGAPELVVIGDSLAEGTAPLLPSLLPGWRVTTHARTGRFLAQGMTLLEQAPFASRRPILAFSLFTNDDPRNTAALEVAVRRALAVAGPTGCVIWATIRRPKLAGVSYGAANARLLRLAAEATGPRLVLVPWAATVARTPTLLARDRVHPTPAGYARRAAMFAEAAQECAGEGPPPPAVPPGGAVAPSG